MKENRERLAWTVLIISFAVFMAVLLGIPFGVYQWVQRATISPTMELQVLEGTAQIEPPDDSPRQALANGESTQVQAGARIWNDAETETLLTIVSPNGLYTLATVQIYPNTELIVSLAKSPRYDLSATPHRVEITVETGRVRLGLSRETDRDTDVRGRTSHAQFLLWEAGSYSLDVSNRDSQITVREGKATIFVDQDSSLVLEEKQRGVAGVGGTLTGPLRPERDLIVNGHFRQPLDQGWYIRTDAVDASESAGTVEIVTSGGSEAVRLYRAGTNHAETGIYQTLNQSLSDYQSLQLHLSARVDFQDLGVCGTLGSECPLMVRIKYRDLAGNEQHWVQGFYYWVDPSIPTEDQPALCVLCPSPRQDHEQENQGIQFFYDSPNLIELLAQNGRSLGSIVEIGVYASGHSYDVTLGEIELLVQE
jgi:hypothetical protein